MKLVVFAIAYVAAVVCNQLVMEDTSRQNDNKVHEGKGEAFYSNVGSNEDTIYSNIGKENSRIGLKQFIKKRGRYEFSDRNIPPSDDDRVNTMQLNEENFSKINEGSRSEHTKRSREGKMADFSAGALDDKAGDRVELDSSSDDFQMPVVGNSNGHRKDELEVYDFLLDDNLPVPSDNLVTKLPKRANGFRKVNDDFESQEDIGKDLNEMDDRLRDTSVRREKENEDYLDEEEALKRRMDYNLGIATNTKDKRNRDKNEWQESGQKKETLGNHHLNNFGDLLGYDFESAGKRMETTERLGTEKRHCSDMVVSMICKRRVNFVNYPLSKRVCNSKNIQKRCIKFENKRE